MFAKSHSLKQHPGQIAGVAGIAAGIGAISALLLTPKRGSEMRQGIKTQSLWLKNKAANMQTKSKESAKDMAETAKSGAKTAASKAKNTADKVKDDAKEMADEIRRNGEP